MEKVKVGLIGTGFSGEIHAEAFKRVPEAEVVAVASRTEAHVKEFAEKHKIKKWFTDYRELLKLGEIDLVSLCVPNYLHCQMAVEAAEAGKHIICEKPLCMNLEEADLMIETCQNKNVLLMYAETLLFTPKYQRAKELVDEGAVGKVYLIKQSEKHFGPHSEWFWDIDKSGGGAFMDMGCHGSEYARYVLGKPKVKSVYAQMGTYVHKDKTRGEDNSMAIIEFEGDAVALIESSWVKRGGMDDRVEIYGSEGLIYADLYMGTSLLTYSERGYGYAVEKAPTTKGWTFTIFEEIWQYGFPQEMQHFVNCVLGKEKPKETGEDGKVVLEIIYAAYESARTGKKVELPFQPKVKKPIDLYLPAR